MRWHALSAVLAYDAQLAASGITTVFDSLRAGSDADAAAIGRDLPMLAEAIGTARTGDHLKVDHRTHLRCEIASPDVIEQAEAFAERFPVHLISLMDHTPGQRQFRDLETWRRFYMRKTPLSDAEVDLFVRNRLEQHARHAERHRRRLVALAARCGAVLASHDDASGDHVAEAIGDGVAIAEFPTTLEAARASHRAGIAVMMGGPNVVRGGSHSGNVAAEELAREGVLDILSSDYIPASLASPCRGWCSRSTSPQPCGWSPSRLPRRRVSTTAARREEPSAVSTPERPTMSPRVRSVQPSDIGMRLVCDRCAT